VHPEEVAASEWLRSHVPADDVQSAAQADPYTAGRLRPFTLATSLDDIVPPLLRRDSFVLLGYSQRDGRHLDDLGGRRLVTYRYPLSFLADHKSLVFSNGGSELYR